MFSDRMLKRLQPWWIIKSNATNVWAFSGIANYGMSWDWNRAKISNWWTERRSKTKSCLKHSSWTILRLLIPKRTNWQLSGWVSKVKQSDWCISGEAFPSSTPLVSTAKICLSLLTMSLRLQIFEVVQGHLIYLRRLEQPPTQTHYWVRLK